MSLQIDGNIHVQIIYPHLYSCCFLNSDNNIKSLIKQGRVELICFFLCNNITTQILIALSLEGGYIRWHYSGGFPASLLHCLSENQHGDWTGTRGGASGVAPRHHWATPPCGQGSERRWNFWERRPCEGNPLTAPAAVERSPRPSPAHLCVLVRCKHPPRSASGSPDHSDEGYARVRKRTNPVQRQRMDAPTLPQLSP